ncbi:uncharacterized protein [Chelonus insularis]|uniref:uncharacterized protein n=1 Tax=Chelonus insularis TaxID=460826 RepID=UPI00158B9B3D|nr:uncharacterized protein LOC118067339 [Chelonus insularis]
MNLFLIFFLFFSAYISDFSVISTPVPIGFLFPGPSSDDYPLNRYESGPQGRHLFHKKKHHGFPGGHGCRGHGCGGGYGWQPDYEGYYPDNQPGGSFATASAGSLGPSPYGGSASQANAQSATFNFGPISASFSNAQASSGGYSSFKK